MDKYQELREMLQNDCEHLRFRGDFVRALLAERDALLEALDTAVATIKDYLEYEHDGDPWSEDARAMGEMDIDDYETDGRLEKAVEALEAANRQEAV